jgi:hypothetical protein
MTDYQAIHLTEFRRFIDRLRQQNLIESSWPDAAVASFDEVWSHRWQSCLWEGVVALYGSELGLTPKRFSTDRTNLDFDLSSAVTSLYAECVVPNAGDQHSPHAVHRFQEADFQSTAEVFDDQTLPGEFAEHSSKIEDDVSQFGLRVTNTLTQKNTQIGKFFEDGASPAPTVVFVNTALVTHYSHISSTGLAGPSPFVSSLFGIDGVPTFQVDRQSGKVIQRVIERSSNIKKGEILVGRNGFCDMTLANISAVIHIVRRTPFNLVFDCGEGEYKFAESFAASSELILNPTALHPLTEEMVTLFHRNVLVESTPSCDALHINVRSASQA